MFKKITFRMFLIIMAFALSFNQAFAAFEFVTDKFEPDEVEMVIEAEDFTGSGFSVENDATASGGKAIVSGNGVVSYTFTLDSDAEKLTIYGIHKSASQDKALSYIAIEGFEHYALYDYEYNVWNSTRLFFGNAKKGSYTINLTGVRSGQRIDKIIVKYNKVEAKEDTSAVVSEKTEVVEEDTGKYRKGNPELEAAAIAVMEEGVAGSFMAECENGTFNKQVGGVVDSNAASGGKAYISTSIYDNRNSESGETELKYKFYISKNGTYKLWLRYYTPSSTSKDAWMSLDGISWTECTDGSVTGEYKWKSFLSADLGVGWHTIEVKHRTNGWLMDKFLLTSDSSYTPTGLGALPGAVSENSEEAAAIIREKRLNPKVKSNNFRFRSDADFEFVGDDIMVPSTNIAQALGIHQQNLDGYFLLMREREYMKFYDGSSRVISSGSVINTPKASYSLEAEDDIVMVSLKAAQSTFGFDYEYDASENTIHIFDSYIEPEVRTASDDELIVEAGKKTIYYTIPYDNPNAKVEVFFKYSLHDINGVRNMNWDNLNKLDGGGMTYKIMDQYSSHGANYWYRAQTPVYSDGAFRGVQFTSEDRQYYVKVVITDNAKQDMFMKKSPSPGGWESKLSPEEYKYNTNCELLLVPTFENISYYIDYEGTNTECSIFYRKVGDEEWKDVFTPMHDTQTNQFRGTIAFVKQDTEYEVKAVISEGGKTVKESTATVHTWQDNPPIAQTVKLKDIYSGNGDLLLLGYKGTADGWIKIDGEGMTVDAGKVFYEAVTLSECEYLIFENVKVRGGTEFGIIVDEKCHDIRIVNCDIAQWGTGSVQDPDLGAYYRVGNTTNQRAGIQAVSSVNFVVERCYIHDCDSNSNPWKALNYSSLHPMGSTAIMMWGQKGTVIRHNDFVGSDKHRFNDVLEGAQNGNRSPGSTGSDSDIYGNLLVFSNDDAMELDGAQMNTRVYQNRIENTYCGISTAPMTMGPGYIYRNIVTNMGDVTSRTGTAMKTGGSSDHWPRIYFFNNLFRTSGGCLRNANYSGSTEWHGTTRNTIFAAYSTKGVYGSGRAIENTFADERDDFNYDLICGTTIIPATAEKNGIFATPEFVNDKEGDFRLVEGSPGYKAGTPLGSFTATDTPNMGVFAGDENDANFIPARPVDLSADIYQLNLKPGETGTVKISIGDVEVGHTYSLMKNRDFDFITIENEEKENVELVPNSTVELKIMSEVVGKAVVLLRLDNGYSIPIIVYCQ